MDLKNDCLDNFVDPGQVKMGWFGLVSGKSIVSRLIQKITHSDFNHIFICGGGYYIIEAIWCGVRLRDMRKYKDSKILFCKVKDMTDPEIKKFAFFSATRCTFWYSYFQILFILISKKTERFDLIFKWLNRHILGKICSEVAVDSAMMCGYNITNGKLPYQVAPGDLAPEKNPQIEEKLRYEPV